METSKGGVIAIPVEVVTDPKVALMFAVPIAAPITSPLALTGATAGVSEAQVTEVVTSCVLPSV